MSSPGKAKLTALASCTNLSRKEVKECRKCFSYYDKQGSGSINAQQLREAIQALGLFDVSDEDLPVVANHSDVATEINFEDLLRIVSKQKKQVPADFETRGAFRALGGSYDTTGTISLAKLRSAIEQFGLDIDTSKLIVRFVDENSVINYEQFSQLFTTTDEPLAAL